MLATRMALAVLVWNKTDLREAAVANATDLNSTCNQFFAGGSAGLLLSSFVLNVCLAAIA